MDLDLNYHDILDGFDKLGKDEWVTIYSYRYNKSEHGGYYCALIANNRVEKSLSAPSWDLHIGNGLPGFVFHYENGKEIGEYHRFSDSEIEPLIISRNFHGVKDSYWEVSEEFRHYFNLYEDKKSGKYIHIDDDGDEEDVVAMEKDKIIIKLKYLKEYLAVKNMKLALFFDFNRFSEKTLEELSIKEFHDHIKGENYIYSIGARLWDSFGGESEKSHAWLMGKKIIAGAADFRPKLFGRSNLEYENFIIGVDEEGHDKLHTCNPEKLSDYFGKNPGEPHYLTSVFFKKEVLSDYYASPSKYSVEDGYLRCSGLWGLRMDNNHADYVVVFLGDLGQDLSIKEQRRWKRFNITPQGNSMSRTAWERGFEAKFTDPEKSDLFFKQKYHDFQEKWRKKYGWDLFRPLSKEDEHHLKTLRVPLTNEQKEFDEQVLSITKVLIDSLNEEELKKHCIVDQAGLKGISKFEMFLNANHANYPAMIKFLRNIQELRSTGIAHLKGEKYVNIKAEFKIDEKGLADTFDDILIRSIWTINTLERRFLN